MLKPQEGHPSLGAEPWGGALGTLGQEAVGIQAQCGYSWLPSQKLYHLGIAGQVFPAPSQSVQCWRAPSFLGLVLCQQEHLI